MQTWDVFFCFWCEDTVNQVYQVAGDLSRDAPVKSLHTLVLDVISHPYLNLNI